MPATWCPVTAACSTVSDSILFTAPLVYYYAIWVVRIAVIASAPYV